METVRWLWESTEDQLPILIEATFQRILERDPLYGDYTAEDIELNSDRTYAVDETCGTIGP
jgi:hypothetical protein